jgi:hypothetical protein
VVDRLGSDTAVSMPIFPGAKIVRWRFAQHGMELLGKDRVFWRFS